MMKTELVAKNSQKIVKFCGFLIKKWAVYISAGCSWTRLKALSELYQMVYSITLGPAAEERHKLKSIFRKPFL